MTAWHEEVLPPAALRLAAALGELSPLGQFYLAEGTDLALQRGHRVSVDLDFFSAENPLGKAERDALRRALSGAGRFKLREPKEGTLHAVIDGVETSFLRYDYPLVARTSVWKGLRVASPADIGLMKIGAVIGRGSRKDFRDLREIVREVPLRSLLRLASRKFPDAEDFLFQASKALVCFEDAERQPEARLLRPEAWEGVKGYFEREVPRVFRSLS